MGCHVGEVTGFMSLISEETFVKEKQTTSREAPEDGWREGGGREGWGEEDKTSGGRMEGGKEGGGREE